MSYLIKDNKIYKTTSGNPLGEVRNNKIYKPTSGNPLGEVRNNKIYKPTSGNPLGDMSKIRREIKDSSIISDAHLVAIYHFLIKSIF